MVRIAISVLLLLAPVIAVAADSRTDGDLVRIEQTELRTSIIGAVVLLKAQGKAIPIFVDGVVAESIQGALSGQKFPRPLSHDLMRSILEGFDGKVTRVVIALKAQTYYADLTVSIRGATKVFDSRSSDAIALAIHFKAPMLVTRDTFEKAAKVLDETSKPEGTRL